MNLDVWLLASAAVFILAVEVVTRRIERRRDREERAAARMWVRGGGQ